MLAGIIYIPIHSILKVWNRSEKKVVSSDVCDE